VAHCCDLGDRFDFEIAAVSWSGAGENIGEIEMDWLFAIQLLGLGIAVGLGFGNCLDSLDPLMNTSEALRYRLCHLSFWELIRLENSIEDEMRARQADRELTAADK
jgi:hypothetical protein